MVQVRVLPGVHVEDRRRQHRRRRSQIASGCGGAGHPAGPGSRRSQVRFLPARLARWRSGCPREPHELETAGSNPARAPSPVCGRGVVDSIRGCDPRGAGSSPAGHPLAVSICLVASVVFNGKRAPLVRPRCRFEGVSRGRSSAVEHRSANPGTPVRSGRPLSGGLWCNSSIASSNLAGPGANPGRPVIDLCVAGRSGSVIFW